MQAVTTVGLDIAKSVFQVHCVDVQGKVIIRRQLKRRQVVAFFRKLASCLVGMEACASSHHWSRELQELFDPEQTFAARERIRAEAARRDNYSTSENSFRVFAHLRADPKTS